MLNVSNSQIFLASENNTHIEGDADWAMAPPRINLNSGYLNQQKLNFGAEYKCVTEGTLLWSISTT
jgi:hypothetical protein